MVLLDFCWDIRKIFQVQSAISGSILNGIPTAGRLGRCHKWELTSGSLVAGCWVIPTGSLGILDLSKEFIWPCLGWARSAEVFVILLSFKSMHTCSGFDRNFSSSPVWSQLLLVGDIQWYVDTEGWKHKVWNLSSFSFLPIHLFPWGTVT